MHISPNSCLFPTRTFKYSPALCSATPSVYIFLTHTTRPTVHHIHYNKNVHVTSYRQNVHTISVKWFADALTAEDSETEEVESHKGMKTEVAASYNGGVTQLIPHCSIGILNCVHWWWACCINRTTGPWQRVKIRGTSVYHHKIKLATSYSTKIHEFTDQ
jgi:hypothetical protein